MVLGILSWSSRSRSTSLNRERPGIAPGTSSGGYEAGRGGQALQRGSPRRGGGCCSRSSIVVRRRIGQSSAQGDAPRRPSRWELEGMLLLRRWSRRGGGGSSGSRPRRARMGTITSRSAIAEIHRLREPHAGHSRTSRANTRASNADQPYLQQGLGALAERSGGPCWSPWSNRCVAAFLVLRRRGVGSATGSPVGPGGGAGRTVPICWSAGGDAVRARDGSVAVSGRCAARVDSAAAKSR